MAASAGTTGTGTTIPFDARLIARKEEGWDTILYALVSRWVGAIAAEARGGSEVGGSG